MITGRDFLILHSLTRYYILNRVQIQRLVFPSDTAGCITRRRLQVLVDAHLVNRQSVLIAHDNSSAAPVYFPSRTGCELLAERLGDEWILLTPSQAPIPHHTLHWLAVSDTHMALDAAVCDDMRIEGWINEWDVVNKDESAPEKRFRLYTLIRENPRLVCAPDAAFLLWARGHSKVFYLEQDRGTSGVQQVANSKTAGYVAMAERNLHRKHFPNATVEDFSVLMVAPSPRRRDALCQAIKNKPGAEHWRFVAAGDLTPKRLLYEPIYVTCAGEAKPLLKRDVP